jgi:hypothetical protein
MFEDHYEVEVHLLERSVWEHERRIEAPVLLRYLGSDYEVVERYLPAGNVHCIISLPKGMPLIAAAYPFGEYAPSGCLFDPRTADAPPLQAFLDSREGPAADALLRYRKEFAPLLSDLDLNALRSSIWEGTGGRPWTADWGSLYLDVSLNPSKPVTVTSREEFEIEIPFESGGWWLCDQRGIKPLLLNGPAEVNFRLPSGTYTFYCSGADSLLVQVAVAENGSHSIEKRRVPYQLW